MNHFNVSIVKSIIRIIGFFLLNVDISMAVTVLIAAELLGVLEEFVECKK